MQDKLLDLGRPITHSDIVSSSVFPIQSDEDGEVYCYLCQMPHIGAIGDLTPLTRSTGVFTTSVTCENDAPVWVCLEHAPHMHLSFDAFTEEVQAQLRAILCQQDTSPPSAPVPNVPGKSS